MTKFVTLVLLLMVTIIGLLGCNTSGSDNDTKDVFSSGSEIIVQPAPLSVELKIAEHGILELNTTAECIVNGGVEPYNISWSVSENVWVKNCNGTCDLTMSVGKHIVICEAYDSEGRNVADQKTIVVDKKRIDITHVIALGDSLTYGKETSNPEMNNWAYLYSQSVDAELENHAVSGDTSFGMLNQLEQVGDIESDSLVFLWIGSNDVLRFIPLEDFKTNYVQAVNELSQKTDYLVLINIPDVSELSVTTDVDSNVNQLANALGLQVDVKQIARSLVEQYNAAIAEIAEKYDVPVIDIYSYRESIDDSLIAADGFHPNDEGQKLIEKNIQAELIELYPLYELI